MGSTVLVAVSWVIRGAESGEEVGNLSPSVAPESATHDRCLLGSHLDLEVHVSFEIFVVIPFQFVFASLVVEVVSHDAKADAGYFVTKVEAQFREVAEGLRSGERELVAFPEVASTFRVQCSAGGEKVDGDLVDPRLLLLGQMFGRGGAEGINDGPCAC